MTSGVGWAPWKLPAGVGNWVIVATLGISCGGQGSGAPIVAASPGSVSAAVAGQPAWPSAATTGPPAGTHLRSVGTLTISQPGAVVDGLDVGGCVVIKASNVTVKRSRIHGSAFCDSNLLEIAAPATGVLVEDVEVDGEASNSKFAAVGGGGGFICRRCNIHGAGQGFSIHGSGAVTIEDSFVHDLYVREDLGSHNEDLITNGFIAGLSIRHNRLENGHGQTSAISLFADFDAVQNVAIVDNLLAGGGYTIYGGSTCPKPYCHETRHIVVKGNRFSRRFFPAGGQYGPAADFDLHAPGNVWTDNAWEDSGEVVRV